MELIAQSCFSAQTECLAYCLMPNHVHLVLRPNGESGLRTALAEAHLQYTRAKGDRYIWGSILPDLILASPRQLVLE